MDKYILDTSGISKMLELAKSGRNRKVARLYYVNGMGAKEISDLMGYAESVIISEIMVINRIIENNISHKICAQCEKTFYTDSNGVRICPNCKEENRLSQVKKVQEIYKSATRPTTTKKKRKAFKYLAQIEKERAVYNKEHKPYLEYGEFVRLMGY